MRKNRLLGLFLAVLVVGVSACGGGDTEAGDAPDDTAASQGPAETDPSAPETDLEGVPAVVAEVNGEEIRKEEFVQAYEIQYQQASAQAQSSGQDLDQDQLKQQVAQNLITTELLVQEADQRDITVSDEDVTQTLQGLAAQNGTGSVDDFLSVLEEQGMDRDQVRDQVRIQVKIERLVSDESGELTATDQELRALYDQLVAQQEQSGGQTDQEMPPFAKVRPQLEEQVTSQKEAEVAQRLVGELREDADIVVNL